MNGLPSDKRDLTDITLSDLLDRPIAFHRSFVSLTGSVNAALVLSQAIYWQRRVSEAYGGWWYKTRAQWREETGLSRREQETARKRLRDNGILLEERRGMPAKIWYRLELKKIAKIPDRPIAFHRCFVDLAGSVSAALVLSQAVYWQERVPEKREGWWYKTRSQWAEETGLSRYEQETARKRLRQAGILVEQKRGMPAKIWYRIDQPALMDQLSIAREDQKPPDEIGDVSHHDASRSIDNTESIEPNQIDRWAHFPHLECTNPPIKTDSPENHCWADSPHLDWTDSPIKVDSAEIHCWADLPQQGPRWGYSAHQEGPNPPGIYKETETTTEITQPPPQTPPPDEDCRGGCEAKSIPVKAGSECSAPHNENVVQAQEDLIFPKELSGPERQAAQKLVTRCDGSGQEILDVLTAIIRAGEVRKSPLAVLRGIVLRWEAGTFDAAPGLHLAVARRRQAEIQARTRILPPAKSRTNPVTEGARPPPEIFKALRKALKKSVVNEAECRSGVPKN